MIYLDTNGLDTQNYNFDYVRREFLGEVRTLVFDVTPSKKGAKGRFMGRIWVEDEDLYDRALQWFLFGTRQYKPQIPF